jgi:hypothetical protein
MQAERRSAPASNPSLIVYARIERHGRRLRQALGHLSGRSDRSGDPVNEDAIDQRLLDMLGQASNRQLHLLHGAIGRMLADPRRILPIRRDLHLGQTVEFLDWDRGRTLKGQVLALHDRQVELTELGARSRWKLPYTAILSIDDQPEQPAETDQPPATVDPGDGTTWRVGFALLRPVVDV